MSLRPCYNQDANYQTNAKSFMDYLARTNKFLEVLIEDYDNFQELVIAELERIKFDSEMAVDEILNEWLDDGTLARIINDGVLGNKADKQDVEEVIQQLLTKASQEDLSDVIQDVDSLEQSLSILDENKKNKGNSIIHAVDVQKLPNETDDKFINRLLRSLPDEKGTVVLDGTYQLEDTIILTPYQTLQGNGHATKLIMNANNKDMIRLERLETTGEYVYGVKILNLYLHGNMTTTGINLQKSSHLKIEDVFIYETGFGVWGEDVWLAHYDRLTVRNYDVIGDTGIRIVGGTSNLFNNCWVTFFRKGYNIGSMYSSLNSSACDGFTEYAYTAGSGMTFNSCGAEYGQLVEGGYVFGATATGVVFNACQTLNIKYTGSKDNASIFNFNGSMATINNYVHSGSVPISENTSIVMLKGTSYTNFINTPAGSGHSGTRFNFTKYDARSSSVFEQYGDRFTVHRWNESKDFVTE